MSRSIVDRSPDLRQLWEEDYEITLTRHNHLVLGRVPHLDPRGRVAFGRLISKVELTADGTTINPVDDHVVFFAGETPSDAQGRPLAAVINEPGRFELEPGLVAQFRFSSKLDNAKFPNYYAKMTSYVKALMGHALAVDPSVTATPGRAVLEDDELDYPFVYRETASTRAGIAVMTDRLRGQRLAIVGLGGTGGYVLEFVSKTPVAEIHLFDDDHFRVHNAFRAPGAATFDQLHERPTKVAYFAARYSAMKRRVVPHPYAIDEGSVSELAGMDFVFVCAEGGGLKRLLVAKLEEFGVPFIDVGLALDTNKGAIGGILTVTTSTRDHREHAHENGRVDLSEPGPDDVYEDNIQVADLNALNAVLAVIKWKKLFGYYRDLRGEYFATYNVETNHIMNEVEWPAG
jgi:hypothetical protein